MGGAGFGVMIVALAAAGLAEVGQAPATAPGQAPAVLSDDPSSASADAELAAALAEWNQAMAARDAERVARLWAPDMSLAAGARLVIGAAENLKLLRAIFGRRPDLVYVRGPATLLFGQDRKTATAYGQWVERWTDADGPVELRGSYYVLWRRSGTGWRIEHEAFAPLRCAGGAYCRK